MIVILIFPIDYLGDARVTNGKYLDLHNDATDDYSNGHGRRTGRNDSGYSLFEKPELLAQNMAVLVERLGLKVERIQRIRSLFESQGTVYIHMLWILSARPNEYTHDLCCR